MKVERENTVRQEVRTDIKRFSTEVSDWLKKSGFLIYPLMGQSIRTQRDAGRPFWSTWHNDYPDFEALASRHSEVAIRLDELFLPESNRKTLNDQLDMVARMSTDLSGQVRGTQTVIGEAPDYVELAFNHLDATGQYLFGEDFNYGYARTVTPVGNPIANFGHHVAKVGPFDADYGFSVSRDWHPDDRLHRLWATPLVVPV